ncbi:MAG: hypothetical protein IKZ07_06570 [Akkermansia sp.]|nr:hypothetical protein [Akkermansia sp.]
MPKERHLTIEEKRDWLAGIFRDVSGDYSQADKFKAMAEDTRLAQLQEEKQQADTATATAHPPLHSANLLSDILPPAPE